MLSAQLTTWVPLLSSLILLLPEAISFDPGPDAVDFYIDPLMPREGDALILESQLLRKPLKHPPKPGDYRWYYREMDTKLEDFRFMGTGVNFRYEIPSGFQDGYFNLSVTCCCSPSGELFQLESVKLVRIQRKLSVQVFVDRKPLPGNQSEMILALARSSVNMECRIWGMPTRFQFRLPVGMVCQSRKTRSKRRYVSVIRRRCRFSRGPFYCSASNDVSKVKMIHYLQQATKPPPTRTVSSPKQPPAPIVTRSPKPLNVQPEVGPKPEVKKPVTRTVDRPNYEVVPKESSKAQATKQIGGASSQLTPFPLLILLTLIAVTVT